MREFKFLKKPFNTDDYDVTDFRFLGVSPIFLDDNGRNTRRMIFVFNHDGKIVPANYIHEDHDAFHSADVFQVMGNQVFQIPRDFTVRITFNRNTNE